MDVAVLGAGVVGVTTAYYLAAAGHEVTVVDSAADVATQCSHANGAQLSYSYTDAMASPTFLRRLPGMIAGLDAAIRVRPSADRHVARWGLSFIRQCTLRNAQANTRNNLQLAVRSAQLLRELRNELPADFHYRQAGKLVLLRSARELEDARQSSAIKAGLGIRASVIPFAEACDREPAVARMRGPYAGAVYSPGDDVGDAGEFTRLLAAQLRMQGRTKFRFGTRVTGLIRDGSSVRGCHTDDGDLEADAVVVCLGAWSSGLLREAGMQARIAPVRGYSVTLPPGRSMPSTSITDFGRRFVVTRLGEKIRIAGFADFVGFSDRHDDARIAQLMSTAREAAPEIAEFDHPRVHGWAGSRPMTPDGQPLLGRTRLRGLYVNTGHGALGWTLACASAEQLSDQLTGQSNPERPRRMRYRSAEPSPAETS